MMIRRAAPADIEIILNICRQALEAPQWQPSAWAAYLAPASEPPLLRAAFVAESATGIQGFAAATLLRDEGSGEYSRCELDSMAVSPGARQQGMGSALFRAVLAWAAHEGAHHLGLEVRTGNLPALRMYERAGLRPEGRRPRYYADPDEDALLLGMPVTPVPAPADFSTGNLVEGRPPRC